MARKALCFELYESGSKTTNSFKVYLDRSTNAVENSYYYDNATYTTRQLNGTNGFSAWTETMLPQGVGLCRIRILFGSSLCFCSAWFDISSDGYDDYIPYYGTNGPSNGIYRIPVASNSTSKSKILSGTTSLANIPSIVWTIPCSIYLFWGGNYLSGGTTYPPIIAMATVNIGSNYSMRLPSSVPNSTSTNEITYCFNEHNLKNPEQAHSYFNSYGLDGPGTCITFRTGTTTALNLSFEPQKGVLCPGQLTQLILAQI